MSNGKTDINMHLDDESLGNNMDSDNDIDRDTIIDSEDDENESSTYYDEDDEDMEDDSNEDDEEYVYNDDDEDEDSFEPEPSIEHSSSPYSMASKVDLKKILDKRIASVKDCLQVRESVAHALLRHYGWNEERLNSAFWTDSSQTTKDAGVFARYTFSNEDDTNNDTHTHSSNNNATVTCTICYDDYPSTTMLQMPCKHPFCPDCWTHYLTSMINDGPLTCIRATCPQPSCPELITEDELESFAPTLLPRYQSIQLRSFADRDETTRWCPAPGCERIAISNATHKSSTADVVVTCDGNSCDTSFCLKCGQEPHAPVRCGDLAQWHDKCQNESETANWILTNTKQCPKCSKRMEKNGGCNHMTCVLCRHEFCWICMEEWGATHTGGYNCNVFKEAGPNEDEAKRELDKYLHHYQRYHAHAEAQTFAKRELTKTVRARGDEFLDDANEVLVNCRRVLKYTYCLAYYMKDIALITEEWIDYRIDENRVVSRQGSVGSHGRAKRQRSGGSHEGSTNKSKSTLLTGGLPGLRRSGSKGSEAARKMIGGLGIAWLKSGGDITWQTTEEERDVAKIQKEQFEYHQKMLEKFTDTLSEMVEKPEGEINRSGIIDKTKIVDKYMKNILQYCEETF